MEFGTEDPAGFDDDYDFSWGPVKPYLDGDTLVIPVMDVISDSFWGSGLSAKSVEKALRKYANATAIKLVINSPGGKVSEGVAVYTLLQQDPRPVTAHVIGIAASMASIVMLAGDERILHTGALVMVHEPWAWAEGDRRELTATVDMLEAVAESMLDIYVERTGASREELAALMSAETWLTASEARRLGFGTDVAPAQPDALMATAQADERWNQRRGAALGRYKNLPSTVAEDAPLGWRGAAPAELTAALALANAHQIPTFAQALDGVRRARPVAQQLPPREATPPPRPRQQPAALASIGGPETIMNEPLLKFLGLKPGATDEEIATAIAKKDAEAKANAEAKAQAEARAEEEKLARITAEAKANAEAAQREAAEAKAAKERAHAEHKAAVAEALADVIPSNLELLESMCWDGEGDSRVPRPKGLEDAKALLATNPGMRKSSLTGPSAQIERAMAAEAGASTGREVFYPTRQGLPPVSLTQTLGVTRQQIDKTRAALRERDN